MKIFAKSPSLLLLILIACLSAPSLNASSSANSSRAYHQELSEHNSALNKDVQNIIVQHRNIAKNTAQQARLDHEELERENKRKLVDARKINNLKDRERIISQIKANDAAESKKINQRKRDRLAHSARLKKHNLEVTRARYASIKNSIRVKYGKAIKPVVPAKPALIISDSNQVTRSGRTKKNNRKQVKKTATPVTYNASTNAKLVTKTSSTKNYTRKNRSRRSSSARSKKNSARNYDMSTLDN
jgi:hypothetical protein